MRSRTKFTAAGALGALAALSAGAALVAQSATASGVSSLPTATGEARSVSQPSIPGVCATLTGDLTASSRAFTSSVESSAPDTSRIQAALNSCSGSGKAVLLNGSTHKDFLSGPLTIHAGETLVLDQGVTLYASRKASAYQNPSSSVTCGTLASKEGGCNAFITVSGANAGIMGVRGNSGQGSIDGRGDESMLGTSTSWWTLAKEAQSAGDNQESPRLIQVSNSNNFTAYDINLLNSAMFHLYYSNGTGFTVWGVHIETPATTASPSRPGALRHPTSPSPTRTSTVRTASRSAVRQTPASRTCWSRTTPWTARTAPATSPARTTGCASSPTRRAAAMCTTSST